jgi:hypothetical protein
VVEKAVIEHAAVVRARQHGRDASCRDGVVAVRGGGGAKWVRALRGSQRKGKVRAEYSVFFSNAVRV